MLHLIFNIYFSLFASFSLLLSSVSRFLPACFYTHLIALYSWCIHVNSLLFFHIFKQVSKCSLFTSLHGQRYLGSCVSGFFFFFYLSTCGVGLLLQLILFLFLKLTISPRWVGAAVVVTMICLRILFIFNLSSIIIATTFKKIKKLRRKKNDDKMRQVNLLRDREREIQTNYLWAFNITQRNTIRHDTSLRSLF